MLLLISGVLAFIKDRKSHPVEARQAELRSQPEVAVTRLDNGRNRILRKSLFRPPDLWVYWVIAFAGLRLALASLPQDSAATARADILLFACLESLIIVFCLGCGVSLPLRTCTCPALPEQGVLDRRPSFPVGQDDRCSRNGVRLSPQGL